ncbi:MAG: RecX family transcriptional regulator [Tannerella sp.]|jgi:regulatory protein|nr:RecX family transcriptional regulator [Tannerella sp.]
MKTETEIRSGLARYCSQAERCIDDVRKKLNATELPEDAKNRIIDRLIEEKFIDEQRFCRSFVNDKLKFNRWGRIKIGYELKKKHIKPETVADAMDGIDEEEYLALLNDLLKSKKRSTKGRSTQDLFRKLYGFASLRGFESPLIIKILKELFGNIDHEAYFD